VYVCMCVRVSAGLNMHLFTCEWICPYICGRGRPLITCMHFKCGKSQVLHVFDFCTSDLSAADVLWIY